MLVAAVPYLRCLHTTTRPHDHRRSKRAQYISFHDSYALSSPLHAAPRISLSRPSGPASRRQTVSVVATLVCYSSVPRSLQVQCPLSSHHCTVVVHSHSLRVQPIECRRPSRMCRHSAFTGHRRIPAKDQGVRVVSIRV